jgi:hypothetical protein
MVGGLQWENDGVGQGGARDRWFQITTDPQTLDVIYFNNITDVDVNVSPVTFRVNMSVQIAQGRFDPASGTLTVGGAPLNEWNATASPLARSLSEPDIWEGTFNVTNPVGGTVSYKYIMNGVWETVDNRSFVLASGSQTLPVVFFNNATNLALPIPLTFQVNVGVQMALGNFNPQNGDLVEVRGSFLTDPSGNWLAGFVLTNDPANPILYRGTYVNTNDAPGNVVRYQFVLNYGSRWESTGDRLLTLTSTNETVVPLAFFSNVSNLGAISLSPISGGQLTLSWTSGPFIWLQSATSPTGAWQDVENSQGVGGATVNVGSGNQFFRLRGP